jgi:hypothetical protein
MRPQPPVLSLSYTQTSPRRISVRLPVTPARFVVPVQLNSTDFFARWKQIGGNEREAVKDFRGAAPIQVDSLKQVLVAFQLAALDGVDPSPANLVGAGIFSPANGPKAGVLVRVQTSPDGVRSFPRRGTRPAADEGAQMIRATVRSTSPAVASGIATFLAMRLSV